jgi:signal transduction histidine kinase
VAGFALAIGGVTAAIAVGGASPASPLRHAYFVPVIAAATRFGGFAGAAAAASAVVLDAVFVLPDIERAGLTAAGLEGLVTGALLLLVGALTGVLSGHADRQRQRYETLLATQTALAGDVPLERALRRLRACLLVRLDARDLALVVREADGAVIAGGDAVGPASAAAAVLASGAPVFVPDTGCGPRPRRVLVTPLLARDATIGVLALEREGEIDGAERAAVATLGAYVGLALDNARLASRQRRFAEELAQKIADATRRLEEMDRVKSAFVAVASHELRTPLTALQGFSDLLATRRFPAAEVQRLAGIIRDETERLVRIVSDFLDLSRLERGLPPALRRAPVAVAPAIAAALEVFGPERGTHRIHIECASPLPAVHADPDALDRILKNLVSNAMKYSPPGSAVRVRARVAAEAGTVEFSVEDEGGGIPAAALPKVFEPYYRAPDAIGAARGAGIGLAVVKSLVDAHGGSIRVESAPAIGTRMTFVLPAVP